MRRYALPAMALLILVLSVPAEARILSVRVDRSEPFAGGMEFGTTGSYVRISGLAHGELDPGDPLNAVIVNLDKAPRNARGMVEYDVDFYLMRPTDATRGNQKILYDVSSGGRKFGLLFLNEAPATTALNDPATAADAGNGFVFREGYTLVWSGWDPDAPKAYNGLALDVPVATNAGAQIVGTIRDEFVFGTRLPAASPTAPLSYEAATTDQKRARLTVRPREADQPTPVPTDEWAYADGRSIKLLPEGAKFLPGVIYDFRYVAKNPKVLGIGYAATRDLVSFLRYETRDTAGNLNPIALSSTATGIRAALAVGVAQGGRYLRDHLELGFNQDEAKRKVFDGILAHISGAGKVFANMEFGQPNRNSTQHEDHHFPENHFPFAHASLTDPVTGKTGGLLRGNGFDPLVIETNTSTEYWQKGASLLHTDPLGTRDIEIPSSVRLYLIAGTQHGGRAGMTTAPGNCVHPRNPHNPTAALRALLVALDRWVTEGVEPPASRVPTIGAGTLTKPGAIGFPAIPGVQAPRAANHIVPFVDWVSPRHERGSAYVTLVPKVDADGNEVAGVLLPPIAAALGTHTGWNFYKAAYLEGELCDREGAYVPFAWTKADREAKGDPRPSLEERYTDHAGWLKKVSDSVTELLRARLLLPEDAARYLDGAARRVPLQQ